MRVGLIAPPWVPVPPPAYGGTELVLDALARGLARRGHQVQLFTTGDSTCEVQRAWLYDQADGFQMGNSLVELRHTAAAYDVLAACDVVHDHTLTGPFLASTRPKLRVITTNHSPFTPSLVDIYRRSSAVVPVIAVSSDQARRAATDLPLVAVNHHGLDIDRYRYERQGGDHLAFLGRMSHDKGVDVAIDVARQAGVPLLIGAKMREPSEREYFDEMIRPRLGGDVEYLGEVGYDDKVELLAGARAMLNPIRWPEPFGLVMIEAMACGTPVIATGQGAASELVVDGVTGFVAESTRELVAAVGAVDAIDRRWCRGLAEVRFSMDRLARDHELVYRQLCDGAFDARRREAVRAGGAAGAAAGPLPLIDGGPLPPPGRPAPAAIRPRPATL
jgi:glycosyltransferase involved in cell wall biosynthesis